MFKLKKGQETFEVVDGPFAGRKFEKGREYAEIPLEEKKRFVETKSEAPAPSKVSTVTSKAKGKGGV